jgi:enamidase
VRTAIVNIDKIVTGSLTAPFARGDGILMEDGKIAAIGTLPADAVSVCDVVVDAGGTIAIPGLIDSQVHVTFGDYTPRQKVVGYLESYVHGGTTTSISASEVHVPGRPKDPAGVKALALAARACFVTYRPGGMRVHAGSIILEPGLTEDDLKEVASQGLGLAKAGFGAFDTPFGYAPLMQAARRLGMITTMHTGGASIPGSKGIWAEHVIASNPTVSFHVNGGPAAMPEEGFARLVHEAPEVALQICTAGNLRTALLTARLLDGAGQPERLLIATDTPTGSGIMPLGMLYTISHLASLGGMPPEQAIAAATGNNALVYGLNSGFLEIGKDADVVLIDACVGSAKNDALSALTNGDIAAVGAVFTDGVPRFVGRSRNTPATTRTVRVADCRLPQDFSGSAH